MAVVLIFHPIPDGAWYAFPLGFLSGVVAGCGVARNARLESLCQELTDEAAGEFQKTGRKQRLFGEARYGARSWGRERRVVVKAEHTDKRPNPRYVVTNLEAPPRQAYDNYYCLRGEMENRIKEQQLYLFADRTSCHRWWPNQFRLLLSAMAYALMEAIRRLALAGTELARALVSTIRLKLLKVGGVVVRNTRRIRFHLSSSYPYKHLFIAVAQAFDTSWPAIGRMRSDAPQAGAIGTMGARGSLSLVRITDPVAFPKQLISQINYRFEHLYSTHAIYGLKRGRGDLNLPGQALNGNPPDPL